MPGIRQATTAIAVVTTLALAGLAGTARADDSSDARAAGDRFVTALVSGDAVGICNTLTPRAVTALGGPQECPSHFTDDSDTGDYAALETLLKAYRAARQSSAARRGDFVRKHFTVRQLARDMERIDSDLTVKVGKGPKAAAGQLSTTAVLDTRTSARRVVIYAESDGGSIFRATGTAFSDPSLRKVAQGIPEAPKPPPAPTPPPPTLTWSVDALSFLPDRTAYAVVTLKDPTQQPPTESLVLVLKPGTSGYLVDDVLISLISLIGDASPSGGVR